MSSPRKSLCHKEAQRCFFVMGSGHGTLSRSSSAAVHRATRHETGGGGATAEGTTSRELRALDARQGMGSYGCERPRWRARDRTRASRASQS